MTALILASNEGHLHIVKKLIRAGATVDKQNKVGTHPVSYHHGDPGYSQSCSQRYTRVNVTAQQYMYSSPGLQILSVRHMHNSYLLYVHCMLAVQQLYKYIISMATDSLVECTVVNCLASGQCSFPPYSIQYLSVRIIISWILYSNAGRYY